MFPLTTNHFARRWPSMWLMDSDRVPKSFEVRSNELFVVEGTSVFRRSVQGGSWSSETVPPNDADIYQVNGKLFLSAADSIYEFQADKGSWLLASARRKPSATPLDDLESFDYPPLTAGPKGTVRAFLKGNGYEWNGHTWAALTMFTNL